MTTTSPDAGEALAICRVGVEFDRQTVLRNIDLTVRAGEVVALLGGNGSGKSTLVRAALGLVPTRHGQVRIFGTPLERFREWGRIGYVPQRATAASGVPVTVRELVITGRLSRMRAFRPMSKADRAAVDRAIELVGLTERAHDNVAHLSGGQQQRALIARAAAAEPDILVLDEPMAGVDLPSQQAFARALRVFVASGRTVLLVLHELGPLEPLINRAALLRDGRVAYDGPLPVPAQLYAETQFVEVHPHAPQPSEGWWSG